MFKKIAIAVILFLAGAIIGVASVNVTASNWSHFSIPLGLTNPLATSIRTAQVNAYGKTCILFLHESGTIAVDCN